MFRSSFRRLPLSVVVTVALILSALIAGCSQQSNRSPSTPVSYKSPPSSSASPPRSAACTQPKPAPGKLSLAGLAYGPSHTGQDPTIGVFPSDEEVNADMPTIASLTNYIRIYSSIGPANAIIQAAEAAHVCVALGISLDRDPAANAAEMMAGEQLASNTAVHAIIVGNEALLRGDLTAEQLCAAVEQVRAQLGRTIPITVADDYKEWLTHPQLAKCVDFVTVHIYPFWEGKSIDSAIPFLDAVYKAIQADYPGKPIVIGETGWPVAGPSRKDAVPSAENQARYLRDFTNWAQQNNVQYFYFEAFDEDWKIQEHGVGTHWGFYQQDGTIKPGLSGMLPSADMSTLIQRSYRDVYVGSGLEKPFGLGIDTSNHQRNWLMDKHGSLLLNYPANQQWGGMFITVGPAAPLGQRLSLDLSAYHLLLVDMHAGAGGQCVRLGIKARTQPDNGSEITIQKCLTTQWSTIILPLNTFANVDLTQLYVVFEVLFQGATGVTVELRDIRYSPMRH